MLSLNAKLNSEPIQFSTVTRFCIYKLPKTIKLLIFRMHLHFSDFPVYGTHCVTRIWIFIIREPGQFNNKKIYICIKLYIFFS